MHKSQNYRSQQTKLRSPGFAAKNLKNQKVLWSHRSGEVLSVLKHTQEVRNEEATKHQAHGEQGSVWVWSLDFHLMDGHIAIRMHLLVLSDDGVEGIVFGGIKMVVV